jgi:hypothetical protein
MNHWLNGCGAVGHILSCSSARKSVFPMAYFPSDALPFQARNVNTGQASGGRGSKWLKLICRIGIDMGKTDLALFLFASLKILSGGFVVADEQSRESAHKRC